MRWFDQNPNPDPSLLQRATWSSHVWGRQQFAKSYARGGLAATVFAPTRKEMLVSPWRFKAREGGQAYVSRLRQLQALHKDDPGIKRALQAVEQGKPRNPFLRAGGVALGAAFIALPAFTTEGPIEEKARAVTTGIGAAAGFVLGSKAGMGVGAAIGSVVPVVGTAIGAGVGWLAGGALGSIAGESATDSLTRVPDRMVERERRRRNLNWSQHTGAFHTQRAYTMRQQSLALMNRGAMSARSLMGQEATFVHR